MTLTYLTFVRIESDADIIKTLQRKGWIENNPPKYNETTHREPVWNGTKWVAKKKTAAEIAEEAKQKLNPSPFGQTNTPNTP